jgi:Family of unknown function (DUF5519)
MLSSMSNRDLIEAQVLSWEGITTHPHRFGGREYRLGSREIGHIHGQELVDVPLPVKLRDEMIAAGLAERHHILPDSGWVSIWLRTPEDVQHAITVLERSLELARAQAARRSRET